MKYLRQILTLLILVAFQPTLTLADVGYSHPKYRGYALDWCRIFEHGCGQAAANAFCQLKGHEKATHFVKWNNPGVKTMTIGQNSICNPAYHRCDSFQSIRCKTTTRTFVNPSHHGFLLDYCKTFAHQCGQPAANAYCKRRGYTKAIYYTKASSGSRQTMTIGENSICDPRFHRCDTFHSIKCKK